MSENLLKVIKEAGLTHAEVIEFLKKEGKLSDLKTQEEIAEEIEAKRVKAEKAKAEKEKPKEPDEPEPESDNDILNKRIDEIEVKFNKIIKEGLKVPGKTPSKGTKRDEGDIPEGVQFTIPKNMFEVDV